MNTEVDVLVVAGKNYYYKKVENTVDGFNNFVRGELTCAYLCDNGKTGAERKKYYAVYDETGWLNGKTYNCCLSGIDFIGEVCLTVSDSNGDFINMDDEDRKILEGIASNKMTVDIATFN